MSKYRFAASDIYLPGTEIPVNRLNIQDAELAPASRLDEAYFRALHQRTFATLYDWAGAYRTVDMAKGGSLFCRATFLENEAKRIFGELEAENFLKDAHAWPSTRFADRLAYYQGELIALHPFLELNGRITRLFSDLIAIANGYGPIDYSRSLDDRSPNTYILASIACVQRADIEPLRQIILAGLARTDASCDD